MAARWNRPSRCCRIAKVDQLRFAAAREMDVHAIAALAGQGAGALCRPSPGPRRNLDVALPLPDSLPADLLARRPDILAAQARVEAAVEGTRSGACRLLSRHQSGGVGGFPGHRAFQSFHRQCLHLWAWARRCICRSSMPARCAPNMPAPPPTWMSRSPIITARWLAPIKQTADAMTQVKSLAAQRVQQQEAVDSAERAFAHRRRPLSQRPGHPDSHADRRIHLAAGAPAHGGRGRPQAAQQRITLLLTVGGGFESRPYRPAIPPVAKRFRLPQDICHERRPRDTPIASAVSGSSSWALVVLVAAIAYGIYWLLYARYFESTDDAYVGGNVVTITSARTPRCWRCMPTTPRR